MLINQAWQPVPGAEEAEIYPYLRKPDVLSSNSYLIRTAGQIILIDPGALEEQADALGRVIALCQAERLRPLLIYLTHCHIDHTREAPAFRPPAVSAPVRIAACAEGCGRLASGDARFTIAELYGVPFPPFSPDIELLTPGDRQTLMPRSQTLSGGVSLRFETENLNPTGHGRPFYRQVVSLGGEAIELYYTPGHSPDSLCLRIGELLFIGDLMAAANPMVAGIAGWSQGDLIATFTNFERLLGQTGIRLCCPGHGGILTVAQLREALPRLRAEVSTLGDLAEMNADRLHFTTQYALDLIGEAEEVFSAIAGRLYGVAYWLEELDEGEAAARIRTLVDPDPIDACLADFRSLAAELAEGKRIEVDFAHRSLMVIQKIGRLFNRGALENLLPRTLLNRATRLMMDFILAAKGLSNGEAVILVDVNELVAGILAELRKNPHADESIVELADDREAFLAALAARIAAVPLLAETELRFATRRDLPLVRLDPTRFGDALTDLLGQLAVEGAGTVSLSTGSDGSGVCIRIDVEGASSPVLLSEAKQRLFVRRFGMCCVKLEGNDGPLLLRIDQPGGITLL
jgi:glyoxylase-like metal-dependent hydrolase (beta-lactamase superfamily II)